MDNTGYGKINYKEKTSCSEDFCGIVFEDIKICHQEQEKNIIYGNMRRA
jgi:hypothetical protein